MFNPRTVKESRRTKHAHSQRSSSPSTSDSSTLNLFIPSLHDATPLETCITVPGPSSTNAAKGTRKAAVLAHPYGPLGGTLHDRVVQTLRDTLVSHGYLVATFNFRGAGHSKGHTSWTGKAETADYAAIAAWLLNFCAALPRNAATSAAVAAHANSDNAGGNGGGPEDLHLLLGGYSYGALIAAQCPPVAALLASLRQATGPFRAAVAAGTLSAQRWNESHSQVGRTSYSGSHRSSNGGCCGADPSSLSLSPTTTVTVSPAGVEATVTGTDLAAQAIATHYLLVSPPLPPVSMFLLLSFSVTSAPILATATAAAATTTIAAAATAATAADTASTANANATPSLDDDGAREQGSREGRKGGRKVLVAWGDEDAFTSAKKYRRWGDKMRGDTAAGEFVGVEVPGAGHFWAGDDLRHVVDAVDRWL